MEPLSQKKRNIYLSILTIIFIFLVPITLLYSSGYRLGEGFKLAKTGGIFIGLSESNAKLYLNGKLSKKAGILKSGFFVQDLTPRVYHVVVEKEDHRSWEKVLEVLPQRVSEASAFVLPNSIPYVEILASSSSYEEAEDLFATTTSTLISTEEYPEVLATSTRTEIVEEVKRKGDVVLWREGDSLFARWVDDSSRAPSYFCNNGACDLEIKINQGAVEYFDFHPQSNEFVLLIVNDVVIMTEIDPRIPRNEQTLFEAQGVEVRTLGDSIFVKEPTVAGIKIFEYELN